MINLGSIPVLGTCAFPGSGQDVFASQLSKLLSVPVFQLSHEVRVFAGTLGLPHTREGLQEARKVCNSQHGQSYFVERVMERIEELSGPAIVTGLRLTSEVIAFRHASAFHLAFVYADPEKRLSRVLNRKEVKDPADSIGFAAQMQQESALFELEQLRLAADSLVDCNADRDVFLSSFDFLEQKYKDVLFPVERPDVT